MVASDYQEAIDEQKRRIEALIGQLGYAHRGNRALRSENRQRAEYTNQLQRLATWLANELKDARIELREVRKHNRMILDALKTHGERGCNFRYGLQDSNSSTVSTEKE